MSFMKTMQEEQPDFIAVIMMQLSLKALLKERENKSHEAVHSEMKKIHLRETFKPMHWE